MGNCCGGEEDNKQMTIDAKGGRPANTKQGAQAAGAYGVEEEETADIT